MKVVLVAGARPNFMKIAPLGRAFESRNIVPLFCHTGQHKDYLMSDVFIKEFHLPQPNFYEMENAPENTDLVIIVGDTDSSRVSAEIARQRGLKIAHIEAGLRSFDNEMPEEINRIYIDSVSDYLFVTEQSGVDNLVNEGITKNVFLVGNVMIDNLFQYYRRFILLTLHRPSNVDTTRLYEILDMIDSIGINVIYPVHPRVKIKRIYKNITFRKPLSYSEFIDKMIKSCIVVTDSGGVQEEAVVLGKRCVTLRANTERPITLNYGNRIVYELEEAKKIIESLVKIPLWDGKASERIVEIILREKK